MLDNPFRKPPKGLDPDEEAFLAEFGGLEKSGKRDKKDAITEEPEPPADEALKLSVTAGQREAYLNELVDIAPGFKIPRKEHEAVVELLKRANVDLDDEAKIVIEDVVGDEFGNVIRVEENHIIRLDLSKTLIQSLDGVTLPKGLQYLNLARTKTQSLNGVRLPDGLKELQLSESPIQSLNGVMLSEGLLYLFLDYTPIQSLDRVILPEGLLYLNLAHTPIQSIKGVALPEALQDLYISETQIQSLDGVILPEGLLTLDLSFCYKFQSFDGVTLPKGLKEVYLTGAPLSQDPQKMLELKAKYPKINFKY